MNKWLERQNVKSKYYLIQFLTEHKVYRPHMCKSKLDTSPNCPIYDEVQNQSKTRKLEETLGEVLVVCQKILYRKSWYVTRIEMRSVP